MEILIYAGKVSLYWTLFYVCYQLFLRRQTFFVWNRIYLIASLLISFALPFIIYPESAPAIPVIYEVSSPSFVVSTVQNEQVSLFTWTNLVGLLYITGILFMSFKLYNHVRQLNGFLNEGEQIDMEVGKIILINSNHVGSFSFLKWIVVNRNDYENHFDAILRHEMVHMQQGHSWDILFIELMKILFWFNPILILYKKSLQEVHEFLADAEAANRENYATFLVSYALNAPIASLTNHFFKPSQIKTRIQMIYKNRSSKWLLSSYLAAVLLIGTIALFVAGCEREKYDAENVSNESMDKVSIKGRIVDSDKKGISGAMIVAGKHNGAITDSEGNYTIQAPENSSLKISGKGFQNLTVQITNQTSIYAVLAPLGHNSLKSYAYLSENSAPENVNVTDRKIFTVVEEQPEFPGGTKAMYEFLGNNIKYPEAAATANVGGRVFLSFVVTATGEIEDIIVLKGVGYGCDAEAVRVLKAFPKWQPGKQGGIPVNVRYNLPINFELKGAKKVSDIKKVFNNPDKSEAALMTNGRIIESYQKNRQQLISVTGGNPVYVIDGKIEEDPDVIKKIDSEKVQSVSVLKDQAAISAYGERGKGGVVSIIMKK
ncbi:TonB family protein [Dyadobacter sp. NIV53]|uniref:TonB family protein n=1 Tax=Dyadobacter sp. NIV53 TaxID=2861765 RepID=UPI001C887A20|nr:TonB family protein [Dyadobacter sp. NIV53]